MCYLLFRGEMVVLVGLDVKGLVLERYERKWEMK